MNSVRLAGPIVVAVLLASGAARAQDPDAAPTSEQIYAQQKACEARKPPRKAKGAISESLYRRMERVIDAISKNEYADSEKKLKEMTEDAHSDYEKAIVLQTLGFVYASENKNTQAIQTFKSALATNALPQVPHEQMMFNIAQLLISDNKHDAGIVQLREYLTESCNPVPDSHILLASVYAEKKSWHDALKQVNLAIAKAKTPKESWVQLRLALHYELKQMAACGQDLLLLVALAPNKEDYWKQLSSILFDIKKDPEALSTLALADRKGYINEEREFRNLASLYLYLSVPYKAGQVMQRGIDSKAVTPDEKNLQMMADSWLLAREYDKAEAALKRAAAVAENGELYKRLGTLYVQKEEWKKAIEALQKAQQKGGVKDPGDLVFLIGVCAVNLKQWQLAEASLQKAMTFEKTTKMAAEWMNHMRQEIQYQNQVAAAQGGAAQGQDGEGEQNAAPAAPAAPAANAPAPAAPGQPGTPAAPTQPAPQTSPAPANPPKQG
ncbi:MAG TPA: hypothetical protein VM369_02075 [Candidatus Binatia bacterium]|nr:hypothetical protein [Candidatus Binatia bacterium]